jgi:stage V sporulation protein AF
MFLDGHDRCIAIDGRTYPARSVGEPWKDRVMRGSRDGFVETIVFNVALVRRRIRDPRLLVEMVQVGERSRTNVALCYLEDKADLAFLEELKKKIGKIQVEALTMNVQSLAECLLPGRWVNPLPKYKYSERPDTAAAAILDGNVVVMVDNAPGAMILPTSVFDMLEEADDFYFPPVVGTYLRWSRFLVTALTVVLTPLWLLFLGNPGLTPDWLAFTLVEDVGNVPVLAQLLILELCIDGLRLAAVNTPSTMSTPLSVVAGIVVGEYAVSSGWFCPEAMLYMALVTVATYSQASIEMGFALKFMRVMTLILTALLGIWGFAAGIVVSLAMVAANRTLSGKSYIYPLIPFNREKLKRKLVRVRLRG